VLFPFRVLQMDFKATKSTMSSMSVFSKHGITFEDHHFKDPDRGKYRASPPNKLKVLYSGILIEQGPPSKVILRAEINSLKQQTHCMGVYMLIPNVHNKDPNPSWKHVSEDLILAAADNVSGGDGWVVAQASSFYSKGGQRRCLMLPGDAPPFETKREVQTWQEWDGGKWAPSSVKCRASAHGWGEQDGIHNQAVDPAGLPRAMQY